MGRDVLSNVSYSKVRDSATHGGTRSATRDAEERLQQGHGLDQAVDPKGFAHLGPVRMSLPRFDKQGDLWQLTRGLAMAEETLLDTTGSMGNNVDKAFEVLPNAYEMLTSGATPILGRYDPQVATAIFNDVEDPGHIPVLARSQFEMAEKIAQQMTLLVPGRNGRGNGKEDSQFGLFAAAYLTAASINKWGLKYYHFTISDEPTVRWIDIQWIKKLFGDDVLERVGDNGYEFDAANLPDTAQAVSDLQANAHAFFLQVNDRVDVTDQWTDLYGEDHFVMLPDGTQYLHFVKAVIIGLTEGVLGLTTADEFLQEHGLDKNTAARIVQAVTHIPLAAQTLCPNFDKIPMAGDLFREKTDLWPIDASDAELAASATDSSADKGGPNWL